MLKRKTFLGICVGFLAIAIVGMASAQPTTRAQGERGARQRGQGGGPGRGFDPARFRQMMADRMKEQLKVGDDEWKIIEPRLTKVTTLQREAAGGGRGGFSGFSGFGRGGGPGGQPGRGGQRGGDGGRGGRGGRGGPQGGESTREMNATQAASQALREVLEKDDASPEQIRAKLTALRAAKENARQKLAAAQKGLREVLTLKQEAQLVVFGLLD